MLPGDGRTRGPVINPKAKSSRGQAVLEFWTHAEHSIFSGDRPLLLLQGEEGTGCPGAAPGVKARYRVSPRHLIKSEGPRLAQPLVFCPPREVP